jgi:hypothetical protein
MRNRFYDLEIQFSLIPGWFKYSLCNVMGLWYLGPLKCTFLLHSVLRRGQDWAQRGPEVTRSQGKAQNARIEGINELMLQAKVPENHGRLEVVSRALDLTKLLRHLTRCASRPNCLHAHYPHTLTQSTVTSQHFIAMKCYTAVKCFTWMTQVTPFMTFRYIVIM